MNPVIISEFVLTNLEHIFYNLSLMKHCLSKQHKQQPENRSRSALILLPDDYLITISTDFKVFNLGEVKTMRLKSMQKHNH